MENAIAQKNSSELAKLFSIPVTESFNSVPTLSESNSTFQRLVNAYVEASNAHQEERLFECILEMSYGFNYAFDHHWVIILQSLLFLNGY